MKRSKLTKPMSLALIGAALLFNSQADAITLNEYLNQVKQESSGYKAQAEQAEASGLQSREADLLFTPQLFAEANVGHDGKPNTPQMYDRVNSQTYSLGVSQQFDFGLQSKLYYEVGRTEFDNASAGITPSKYWNAMPKLELSLPVWGNGFGRTARANQTALRQQNLSQEFTSESNAQQMLAGAEAAYWRLSAWQDVVGIQEQASKAAQNILDYVSRKRTMNLGEDADVMQARALVEARGLELQVAKNEVSEAQRAFNKFLNKDAYTPVSNLEKVDYKRLESIEVPSQRPGVRADVKAVEAQLEAAKASAVIAKERNRPSLDIYGTYALNGRDEEFNQAMKEAGQTEQDTAYVGLRFKMPLNIGAASDVKSGAMKAEKAAELNRQYTVYSQEQDWINLTRNLSDARDNLRLLGRIESAQKAKLEAERTRLRQGRTTTYQVLLFEQDYSQAALSKVKSAAGILGLQAQIKLYQNSPEGGK